MALLAFAAPILPGKTQQWKHFTEQLAGPRFQEFQQSRQRLAVHERAFLQSTPQGDFVIVTLEGDDPAAAFRQFGQGTDEFTRWFVQQVMEIHGFDLSQDMTGFLPQLIVDSEQQTRKRTV